MSTISYKIYIPFEFDLRDSIEGDYFEQEFDVDGVHLKLCLNKSGNENDCFIFASMNTNNDITFDVEEAAELKIGIAVQSFFDGLTKAYNNCAFFNVFNGEEFIVRHECCFGGCVQHSPARNNNIGWKLGKDLIESAICYTDSKDECLKQTFLYMKEGEYLIDIGRYEGAIIQFSIMLEYFINRKLRDKGYLRKEDKYKTKYSNDCKNAFISQNPNNQGQPSFSFSKYVYGLSLFGLSLDSALIRGIDGIYRLRNKLAHGYNIYDACQLLNIEVDGKAITPHNVWEFSMFLLEYVNEAYDYFEKNFSI